jgi:hypothetical protein
LQLLTSATVVEYTMKFLQESKEKKLKVSKQKEDNNRESKEGNQTITTSSSNINTTTNKLPTAIFSTEFNMVMLNGSAMHKHQLDNFTLTSISIPNNLTAVYNGTASITMKEGPVHNVPVSIMIINDNVISISVDPTKVNNHFENTPIFGTLLKHVIVKK